MKEINIIKINYWIEIPGNYSGVAEFSDGTKAWYKEGQRHRENGPAVEYSYGKNFWYINGIRYTEINLKDHVVLDYHQGPYNLMWYKLLTKDKIIIHPDIPGLIEK